MGTAFQIQDDILNLVAEEKKNMVKEIMAI